MSTMENRRFNNYHGTKKINRKPLKKQRSISPELIRDQKEDQKSYFITCSDDDDPILIEACNEVLEKFHEEKTKSKHRDEEESDSDSSESESESESESDSDDFNPNIVIYRTKEIIKCMNCGHKIVKKDSRRYKQV